MIFSKNLIGNFLKVSKSFLSYEKVIGSHGPGFKVAVLGACGGIGQPLSLLLKRAHAVGELALYDVSPGVAGIRADLSHIPTATKVTVPSSAEARDSLEQVLTGADIAVVLAGKPRRPGMTRADLFSENAATVAPLIQQIGQHAPHHCLVCIVTNPVNSLVPMAATILRATTSDYDPARLFGVTTLDSVRASAFVGAAKGLSGKSKLYIPVMGGHSETTLIPVISQSVPPLSFPPAERAALIRRIQTAGTALVEAKAGEGSATLCMAYAADRFISSLLSGLQGFRGIVECAFVESAQSPCEFFATPIEVGPKGVACNMGVGNLLEFELTLLRAAMPELEEDITVGKEYANRFILQYEAHQKKKKQNQ